VSAYTAYTQKHDPHKYLHYTALVFMSTEYILVYLILFLQDIIYYHLTAARKYQTTFYFSENLKGRSFYTVLFMKIKLQLLFYILMKSK
jgi:hypothetical protein